jgi:hypothetical protein
VVPQDDLGASASPSHMRSAAPTVVGEALAGDARTATPPRGAVESRATSLPVVDSRVETTPRAVEVGELLVGTSERRPAQELLMLIPSVQYLVGLRTSLRLTRRQED